MSTVYFPAFHEARREGMSPSKQPPMESGKKCLDVQMDEMDVRGRRNSMVKIWEGNGLADLATKTTFLSCMHEGLLARNPKQLLVPKPRADVCELGGPRGKVNKCETIGILRPITDFRTTASRIWLCTAYGVSIVPKWKECETTALKAWTRK